jgi:hypothetical protein
MDRIKSFKLFESENYYQTTSWTDTIDGAEKTITIQEVEEYLDSVNAPVKEVEVDEIIHLCAHRDKTDTETLERSERANLSYPIIISRDKTGKYNMILDGMHRVLKAYNHKMLKIKARILDLREAPRDLQIMFR